MSGGRLSMKTMGEREKTGPKSPGAAREQVVSGLGDGRFGPDEAVKREQLAVIMMNYAKYLGLDPEKRADLGGFVDAGEISAYAQEAMSWANAVGLLNGKGDGVIDSQGTATRAEVAAIIARFDQMTVQIKE